MSNHGHERCCLMATQESLIDTLAPTVDGPTHRQLVMRLQREINRRGVIDVSIKFVKSISKSDRFLALSASIVCHHGVQIPVNLAVYPWHPRVPDAGTEAGATPGSNFL